MRRSSSCCTTLLLGDLEHTMVIQVIIGGACAILGMWLYYFFRENWGVIMYLLRTWGRKNGSDAGNNPSRTNPQAYMEPVPADYHDRFVSQYDCGCNLSTTLDFAPYDGGEHNPVPITDGSFLSRVREYDEIRRTQRSDHCDCGDEHSAGEDSCSTHL